MYIYRQIEGPPYALRYKSNGVEIKQDIGIVNPLDLQRD